MTAEYPSTLTPKEEAAMRLLGALEWLVEDAYRQLRYDRPAEAKVRLARAMELIEENRKAGAA